MYGDYTIMPCQPVLSFIRGDVGVYMSVYFVASKKNLSITFSCSAGGARPFGANWKSQIPPVSTYLNGYYFFAQPRYLDALKKILVGVWVLWKNRNSALHVGKCWSIDECVLRVKSYLHTFIYSRIMQPLSLNEPDAVYKDKWTYYCDGSWCKSTFKGGFVAVAAKEDCIFRCKVGWMEHCLSPAEAEMKAVLAAVDLATEMGVQEAEFVSNNVEVVLFLSSDMGGSGNHSLWLEGLTSLSLNPGWSVRFIFREYNSLADGIANYALRCLWEWHNKDALPRIITGCMSSSFVSPAC